MDTMLERMETPVRGEADVLVCGGGVAGVAAAVSAARSGASVLLLEKGVVLGGLATTGLISWYEPLCDGEGHKMTGGLAVELLRRAISVGDDTLPEVWREDPDRIDGTARYATHFSPGLFAMELDRMLAEAGVRVLLDTVTVLPVMEGRHCAGVIVENKTGRGFYRAGMVIDTTGDADILARAGVPCVMGGNFLTYVAYRLNQKTLRLALESGNLLQARKWVNPGSDLFGNGHPEDFPKLSGVTAEEVTQFVLRGRSMLYDSVKALPRGTEDIITLPGMAQFRTTRRLAGAYTFTEADEGKHLPDAIAAVGDFTYPGKRYEIPFGALYHPEFDNLLTAGRSASGSGWGWEVLRVIPSAVATAEAAGTAAALALESGKPIGELDIRLLQQKLRQKGVRTNLPEKLIHE